MPTNTNAPRTMNHDHRHPASWFVPFNNPIAWATFKVRGGLKNHFWITAGYTLLITAVIIVTLRLNPRGAMLLTWTKAMLGLQLSTLVLFGGTLIGHTIRRDITSGLLESHRLMPVSSGSAVIGYMIGPTSLALSLSAVNFVIGTTTAALSGVPINAWLTANAIIVLCVAFLWVGATFVSFVARNAFGILFGLMMSATVGNSGGAVDMVPAINVLITPLLGNSIFFFLHIGKEVTIGYLLAFIAQLIFGTIFFLGAMRRYRRDDVPPLGVTLGLLLLAAWIVTSAMSIARWPDFHPVGILRSQWEPIDRSAPIIATLLTAMLLGLVPISAAARGAADWMRTLLASGRPAGRRPISPLLISFLAALIAIPIVMVTRPDFQVRAALIGSVAVVVVSYFISTGYLLRIFYRAGRNPTLLLAMWIVLTWLIPIGLDALRHVQLSSDDRPLFSLASPWGELIDLWAVRPTGAVYGLVCQVGIALVMAILFHMGESKVHAHATGDLLGRSKRNVI